MSALKEHGINVSLSTVATLIPVLAAVWFVIRPALVESVSDAVAEDVQDQIEDQAEPLQNAFKIILKKDIDRLKKSIALLEFRESHQPDSWLAEHAEVLAENKIELEALSAAYAEL